MTAIVVALGASALGIVTAAPAWFGARATFPVGTRPYSVAIGDLNNDGIADLAVANNGSISVSVLLGDGYGTFGPKTDYATSGQPWYVAIGDLNADGNRDLVTANYTGGNVSVFLGNGSGAFGPKTDIATTGTPFAVVIADFNGDGKPDLATPNGGANRVSVLLSTTNPFATTPTFGPPTTFTTGQYPAGLAVGDINTDGKLDLVVANDDNGPNGNSFSVLLGNGAGSFGPKTDFAVGVNPVGAAVADVNSDGRPDVVVANTGSTFVSFFLNTTSSGATLPTFGPRTDLTTGSGQWSAEFADLNGDAILDLAVAKVNSTISIFPGDGTGAFGARTDFSTGTNTQPHSLAIGDLNRDGKLDLVTANQTSNNVSVLLDGFDPDTTPPVITPTVTGTLGNNGWYTSDVALTWTVTDAETLFPVTTTDCQPQSVTIDTPGITFICRATSSGGTAAGIVTIKRDASGTAPPAPPATTGPVANSNTGTRPYSVAIGDLNNDGISDLAVANNGGPSVSVLLGVGTGAFGPKTDYATSGQPWYVAIGDLNADGNLDLVTANYTGGNVSVFLGNGTGAFGPKTDIVTTGTPFSVVIADFNGDGKPDLATANGGANRVSVLLSTTSPFAAAPTFSAPTTFTTGQYPVGLAVGDMNMDGKLDLVVTNDDNGPNGNSFSVLFGNGAGAFGAKADFAVGVNPVAVAVADVNGDGRPDVVVANSGTTYVSFFLNTTAQGATTPTFGPRNNLTVGSGPWSVQFDDVNGDGYLDIAAANVNPSTISVLLGDGTGSFGVKTDFSTGTSTQPHSLAIGDLNGDGQLDLVTANQNKANVTVLLNSTVPPAPVDTTPPTITPTVAGTLGTNGWYTSNVAIAWTVTDAESTATTSGCGAQNVTSDTTGVTFTCSATSSGGSASGSVTIKRDTTPPFVTASGPLVVEATTAAGAPVTFSASAVDLASGPLPVSCTVAGGNGSVAVSSGDTFAIGSTVVTCTATDLSGHTGSATFTVSVADSVAPELSVEDVTATALEPSGTTVSYTPAVIDSVDPAPAVSCSPTSGSSFPIGTTAVTCTATDASGNSTSRSFEVHVLDGVLPIVAAPTVPSAEATSSAGAVVTFDVTATDNHDGTLPVQCAPASGSTFAVGTTNVHCVASDQAGNDGSADLSVTVTDLTPPVLSLADTSATATSGTGAAVSYAATASDVVDGPVTPTCAPASGAIFPIGATTVECSAVDSRGNERQGSFTVSVHDGSAPVVTVPASVTIEAASAAGATATFASSATDNYDSSLSTTCSPVSGSTFALGSTTVTCSATDAAGNTGTASFQVAAVDTTPPTLSLPAPISADATSSSGAAVTFPASAMDAVDGAAAVSCSPSSGSVFPPGTTPVSCSTTDSRGNTTSGSFTVTVTLRDNRIERFVAFSRDYTWLRENATVVTGDVGANERRYHNHQPVAEDDGREDVTVRVGQHAEVQHSTSRVVGSTVIMANKSAVNNVVTNLLFNKKGTVRGTVNTTMPVPYLALPAFPSVTPGTQAVTVAKKKTITLPAGAYGDVSVDNGATLILTGGLYQFRSLTVAQQGTIQLGGPSEVRILRDMKTKAKSRIILDQNVPGLSASQMVFYVAAADSDCTPDDPDDDGDDAGPVSVSIGQQSVVQAAIYAKNGTVWLRSKTQATGQFIGLHVRIGQRVTLTLASAFQ